MAKRQKVDASGVDFVLLCENIVLKMEEAVKGGKLLNPRQCKSLTTKLSKLIAWVREVLESIDPTKAAFAPLLSELYRNYEKANLLVKQCAKEDWCAAAVVHYCTWDGPLHHIAEEVTTVTSIFDDYTHIILELSALMPMPYVNHRDGFFEDGRELRKRLEDLASERSNSSFKIFGFFLSDQTNLKNQCLAQFLLKRKYNIGSLSTRLDSFLWEKEDEPRGTWGDMKFLGAGSGASGVLKTSWLGVPCARKEFHEEVSETMFIKEVDIMARLNHPNIVNFICYGNGEEKGDRFIAMELMEKSLFDLIKKRKGVHFSLEVALDIMWQIACGVEYLHECGVAHRDLKPQNVVVRTLRSPYHEDYYCVKLVDFGTCKSEVEASKSNTMSYRGIGTTRYRAPEVHPSAHPECLGKVNWFEVDAYSFAMTCAHILTLTEPYGELESLSKLYTEILNGRRPILPRECPKELVDLMKECWSNISSNRPPFEAIRTMLESIRNQHIRQRIQQRMYDLMISMIHSQNKNVAIYDIKEEQCEVKEEGHSSYFTAEDASFYTEGVSQERDSKRGVSKPPREVHSLRGGKSPEPKHEF